MTSALLEHILDQDTAHIDVGEEAEITVNSGDVFFYSGLQFNFVDQDVGIYLVRIRNGTNIAIGFMYVSADVDVQGNVLGTNVYSTFKQILDPAGLFTQVTFVLALQGGLVSFQNVSWEVHGHSNGNLLSILRTSLI